MSSAATRGVGAVQRSLVFKFSYNCSLTKSTNALIRVLTARSL